MWRSYRSEVEILELTVQEFRDVGDNCVLALGQIRARGQATGIEFETPIGMAVTIRDGKIVRSVDYLSHAEALKAVGLEE
jgi:ketosteroid isomerase-like protein